MRLKYICASKILVAFALLGGAAFLGTQGFAQQAASSGNNSFGLPDDWTHHRLVFSNPGTFQQAVQDGTIDRWLALNRDPRFVMQNMKRAADAQVSAAPEAALAEPAVTERAAKGNTKIHKDWSMDLGSSAKVGAGQYPAKYSFSTTTVSCSDFIAYNTGLAGVSAGQANIVAYSNPYSTTCSTPVPSVYWAYFSGTGKALSSPVLSLDGTKLAFIENPSSGAAILRILEWHSGEGTPAAAATPDKTYTNTTAGAGGNTAWNTTNCPTTGSCMISVAFQNSKGDTISAPFYDYSSDTIYVGDAAGNLHKFTGVFNGTPGEVTTTWPISIGSTQLASPIYDGTHIFVGNASSVLYSVTASTGAVAGTSSSLGTTGIVDAILEDASAGTVYVPIGDDGSTNCFFDIDPCAAVYKFSSSFSSGSGTETILGTANSSEPLYSGTFDNAYFSSGPSAGHIYVCGSYTATLYQISTSSFTNTNNLALGSAFSTATCSPVTEIYNTSSGTHDWIFLSVTASGNSTGCSGACVYNFDVNSSFPSSATAGLAAAGGSSGIIIDNTSGSSGASQIYYSTLSNQSCAGNGSTGSGTGGCAVQASQAAP